MLRKYIRGRYFVSWHLLNAYYMLGIYKIISLTKMGIIIRFYLAGVGTEAQKGVQCRNQSCHFGLDVWGSGAR